MRFCRSMEQNSEQKKCYLAVDGGNSKTEYRLLDASGKVIASLRGCGSNQIGRSGTSRT